ncbi:MAG: hypothetical protein MZV65_38140 [Chromatiales bacterium]|nr:hypothetical protein [Chromatiales bacterium]
MLRAPATRVTGDLEIHNREISAPAAARRDPRRPVRAERAARDRVGGDVSAIGAAERQRPGAAGAQLPAFIGLPDAIRMTGTDRLAPATAASSGAATASGGRRASKWRPTCADSASTRRGRSPKPRAEPRPTRVAARPAPGRAVPRCASIPVQRARRCVFAARGDERWDLERGAARASTRSRSPCRAQPGLHVGGRLARVRPRRMAGACARAGARRRQRCRTGSARSTCTSTVRACSASSSSTSRRARARGRRLARSSRAGRWPRAC